MNRNEIEKFKAKDLEIEKLKNEIESLKKSGFKNKSMIDPDKYLFHLSVGEFLTLIEQPEQPKVKEYDFTDKKYVYGIAGIASLFGCSKTTAGKILHGGKIDKAVIRLGQKITIEADLAMQLNRL